MSENLQEVSKKAEILIDALPYIRDFNQKVIVIEYGLTDVLTKEQEKSMMEDIALLKTVGMKPIVVHGSKQGADIFHENKRMANLIEKCGIKAVGICGIDLETIYMMLDHDYIPVITPHDIENEQEVINPEETACEIARKVGAEKLMFLTRQAGVLKGDQVIPVLTLSDLEERLSEGNITDHMKRKLARGVDAITNGVGRVHFVDGRIEHGILLELFSRKGVGTVLMKDRSHLYSHEN